MKSQIVEKWLNDLGVQHKYVEDYPVSKLPEVNADINQIRLGSMNEDNIQRLQIAIRSHSHLPAIVVSENGSKPTHYVDGMHRATAFRREGVLKTDLYIVSCDEAMLDVLQRTANIRHGLPLSQEERLEHALHLVQSGRASASDAARMFFLAIHLILDRQKAEKIKVELSKAGFRGHLNQTQLIALNPVVRHSHKAEIARLSVRANWSATEIQQHVKGLARCNSDADGDSFLAALAGKMASRIQETAGGVLKYRNPYVRAEGLFSKIDSYLQSPPNQKSLTKAALKDIIEQFEKTDILLHKRLIALKAIYRKIS